MKCFILQPLNYACLVATFAICTSRMETAARCEDRPNIVFILTDDQGYGDLGRHGHPLLKTPHLDRLGEESVRFDNFYVSPSCSPTRAALLTGRHEFCSGVTHTLQPREHLHVDAITLPGILKAAGYNTGFIGKWHLGGGQGYSPRDRGFQWTSTNVGGPREHFDPVMIRNGKREQATGYREDIFFDDAMDFIRQSGDEPFFCYLATYSPHAPLDAPQELIEPFLKSVGREQAAFLAMVANIDANVGRLMAFLEQEKLRDKTIVVFMNDNGQTAGLDIYNAGMRGCKCTIWEGGCRAISFWSWAGKWKPHRVDNLTAHLDLLPTLVDYARADIPGELQSVLEGFSLRPLLESSQPTAWHDDRILFHHVARWPSGLAASHKYAMAAVRQGNYLLLRSHPCDDPKCESYQSQCTTLRLVMNGLKRTTYTKENAQFHWGVSPPNQWSLYDVKADPACRKDLSKKRSALAGRLAAAYDQWWDRTFPLMIEAGGDKGTPLTKRARSKH